MKTVFLSEHSNRRVSIFLILFMLSFTLYINTYSNEFAFDDKEIVHNDHRIRSMGSLPSIFSEGFWLSSDSGIYRPLTILAFAFNYLISGTDPWSYHILNQLLHGMNVMLLYLFIGNFSLKTNIRFVSAAVFAVHPAAAEAVNLVSGRAELLSMAFTLLAFHLFLQRKSGSHYLFVSFVCYFLGMLSKETSMILPAFLLAHHIYFKRSDRKAFLLPLTGFAITLILYVSIRYMVLGGFGPQESQQFFFGIPWSTTAYTMLKGIAHYWSMAFLPVGIHLNYDLGDIPLATSFFDLKVIGSSIFLAAVICAILFVFRKDKELSFFLLWPFIGFLPVMNVIVPTGILIAPRVMYLPLAGFSVTIAAIIYKIKWPILPASSARDEKSLLSAPSLIAAVCIATMAILTISRNSDWRNAETLFRKEHQLSPNNIVVIKGLGLLLPSDEAEQFIKNSLERVQANPDALSVFGVILQKKGNYAKAEEMFRLSLNMRQNPAVHDSLGMLLSNSGRLDEAESHFREAIRLKPLWADSHHNLGIVMLKKGDVHSAFNEVQEALRLNPLSAEAYNTLGSIYKRKGEMEQAIRSFRKAAAMKPDYYEALYNLADMYELIGDEQAIIAWQEYINIAGEISTEADWVSKARYRLFILLRNKGTGK